MSKLYLCERAELYALGAKSAAGPYPGLTALYIPTRLRVHESDCGQAICQTDFAQTDRAAQIMF